MAPRRSEGRSGATRCPERAVPGTSSASAPTSAAPSGGKTAVDQVSEHQLFLQAFEKPTQIYRYLRTRHMVLPLFLQRSLTYMPRSAPLPVHGSQSPISSREKREQFRVDSLLERALQRKLPTLGSLRLQLGGVRDGTAIQDNVDLNMAVVKANNSKTGHVAKVFTHSCVVRRNQSASSGEVIIPEEAFLPLQDPGNRCVFTLLFVLSLRQSQNSLAGKAHTGKNSVDSDDQSDSEATDTESSLESTPKRSCVIVTLTGEIVIYDETGHCQLAEGDYKILLREHVPQNITSTHWVTVPSNTAVKALPEEIPSLELTLSWGKTEGRKQPDTKDRKDAKKDAAPSAAVVQERRQTRVYYQFIFQSNSRQITEARGDLRCPWCYIDCRRLYSLLKHLKLCHSRFNFNYTPYRGGAKIDVSVNDAYDGSYMGNPQRLLRRGPGGSSAFPLRRTPITYFMVCRPQRPLPTLSEFLQDYQDELGLGLGGGCLKMGATVGHNRVYFHSHSCMPIKPEEFDYDSERENDPPWLREKTQRMLDEFTDVNDGEKLLMKMWNLHVMRMGTVADCHVPHAVTTFIEKHGPAIMAQHLYKNLLLHLANLLEFGLISSSELYTSARRLQLFAPKSFFSMKQRDPTGPCSSSAATASGVPAPGGPSGSSSSK